MQHRCTMWIRAKSGQWSILTLDFLPTQLYRDMYMKWQMLLPSATVCPTGFQCDMNRCIPHDWRCDGHVDCADRSDELNCRVCKRSGDVHCGNQRCISQAHLCDGKIDCPWGQDERNCCKHLQDFAVLFSWFLDFLVVKLNYWCSF